MYEKLKKYLIEYTTEKCKQVECETLGLFAYGYIDEDEFDRTMAGCARIRAFLKEWKNDRSEVL